MASLAHPFRSQIGAALYLLLNPLLQAASRKALCQGDLGSRFGGATAGRR